MTYTTVPTCSICQHEWLDHDEDWGCLGGEEDCPCTQFERTGSMKGQLYSDDEQDEFDAYGEDIVDALSRPNLAEPELAPAH